MPSNDFRLPDDFPDLSLPERTDKPAEPAHPAAPRAPSGWRVGDRVLAPWEPQFLYAGRVAQLDGNRALIQFDDGDAGWVVAEQILPLTIPKGQKVLSRKRMGQAFFPGEIREVRGDEVLVVFADGGEEWTRVGALRIPCQPRGGATPTQVASHLAFLQHLQPGDRVSAPSAGDLLRVGSVHLIEERQAYIRFDDGSRSWVPLEQLVPLQIPVGLRVLGRWRMGRDFHPGTVAEVDGDRIYLRYDDGNVEWTTPAALALPTQSIDPSAHPARQDVPVQQGSGGRGKWFWIVIVIWILGSVLRACSR